MKPYTVAVAGRYAERHIINRALAESLLFTLGVTITPQDIAWAQKQLTPPTEAT